MPRSQRVKALHNAENESLDIEAFSASVLKRGEPIQPHPEDVAAYHGEGKYLEKFREKYEQIMAAHPV